MTLLQGHAPAGAKGSRIKSLRWPAIRLAMDAVLAVDAGRCKYSLDL